MDVGIYFQSDIVLGGVSPHLSRVMACRSHSIAVQPYWRDWVTGKGFFALYLSYTRLLLARGTVVDRWQCLFSMGVALFFLSGEL